MEKKFIVRAKDAGVFYGTIKERIGNEVTMTNARCLWYWDGAASLMQLAMNFWDTYDGIVGKGSTPERAMADLVAKMDKALETE